MMKSGKGQPSVRKQLKYARRVFPRMPENVFGELIKPAIEKNIIQWTDKVHNNILPNPNWAALFMPMTTFDVSLMEWRMSSITLSMESLHESTQHDIKSIINGILPPGDIGIHCHQRFCKYMERINATHQLLGPPLIVMRCCNGKNKVLRGLARVAALFVTGHAYYQADVWLGAVDDPDKKKKLIASAVQEAQSDLSKKEFRCLYPECQELAIGSHSQQHRGQLANIAQGGWVYATCRDHLKTVTSLFFRPNEEHHRLIKQRINQVSCFKGYCNGHDTSVFSSVERTSLIRGSREQVLAFHIRALSYMNARQRHEMIHSENVFCKLEKSVGPILRHPQLINWKIYIKADYEQLIVPCFNQDAKSRLKFVWRVISKNVGVSCCSCITPMDDERADEIIGRATDYGHGRLIHPRMFASLNVVPFENETHVVLAWEPRDDALAMEFVARFKSEDKSVFQHVLNDSIFNRSEDYTLSPTLWENTPKEVRDECEYALLPEYIRGPLTKIPELIDLTDCEVK